MNHGLRRSSSIHTFLGDQKQIRKSECLLPSSKSLVKCVSCFTKRSRECPEETGSKRQVAGSNRQIIQQRTKRQKSEEFTNLQMLQFKNDNQKPYNVIESFHILHRCLSLQRLYLRYANMINLLRNTTVRIQQCCQKINRKGKGRGTVGAFCQSGAARCAYSSTM